MYVCNDPEWETVYEQVPKTGLKQNISQGREREREREKDHTYCLEKCNLSVEYPGITVLDGLIIIKLNTHFLPKKMEICDFLNKFQ